MDSEQPGIARSIIPCPDPVRQALLLTDPPVKTAAPAAPEDCGEKVQGCAVRVSNARHVPCHVQPGELGSELSVQLPVPHLRRLLRDIDGLNGTTRHTPNPVPQPGQNCVSVHIPDHHKKDVGRGVPVPVVRQNIVAAQRIEKFKVPNHRVAEGMNPVRRCKKVPPRHAVGIISPHRKLPPDHLLFLAVLLGRQHRVEHCIREKLESLQNSRRGHVRPINRPIKTGVSVQIPAQILNPAGKATRGPFLRALEQEMFEQVRDACAQEPAFMDRTGPHPGLDTRHRRTPVGIQNHLHPVTKCHHPRGQRWKLHGFSRFVHPSFHAVR